MKVLVWLCLITLLYLKCLYAENFNPWPKMKSRSLTSEEILQMRDDILKRQSKLNTPTTSSKTATTTSTTTTEKPSPPPTTKPDQPGPGCRITDYVKNKIKNIRDWCTNCFVKAGNALKGVLGIDKSKSDERLYRSDDDIGELV